MKKKINILVTGVGGDIGNGVLNCLKKINYHDKLIGCDINEYSIGRPQLDYFYVVPKTAEEDEYIKKILNITSKHSVDFIIPTSENEIKVYNTHQELFYSREVKILMNSSEILNVFLDKYNTIDFFKNNNIPYPDTIFLNEYNNEFEFPIILKRRNSAGSKGVFVANDQIDINYFKEKYDDVMVQEMIGDSNNEFTIGVFSDGVSVRNIAFQRYLGYGSLSRQVELVTDVKIDHLVNLIVKKLNLRGCINIQARKNNKNEYIPFEINPRLSSTIEFRHFFGFEDLRWWLDLYLENESIYEKKYSAGVGVRSLDTIYFKLTSNGERLNEK